MKKRVVFQKIFWTLLYVGAMGLAVWHYREAGLLLTLLTLPPVIDKWWV